MKIEIVYDREPTVLSIKCETCFNNYTYWQTVTFFDRLENGNATLFT